MRITPSCSPPARPKHEPGLLRNAFERAGGALGAITETPKSIVSGTAVGGYHGRKRGLDAEVSTSPKEVALQMFVGNTIQSTAAGAIGGFVVGGPAGAAASVTKDVAVAGAKYALYKRFGKPQSMSRRIAANIDKRVKGGEGAVKGTAKGALAGATGGAAGGAIIGFRKGRGTASGLIEGITEADDEAARAKRPQGGNLRKAAAFAGAGVNSLLSAPAGLAQGLMTQRSEESPPSKTAQVLLTAASGAVVGGSAGVLGGPLGVAVGAGVGAVTGLISAVTNENFATGVRASLDRAAKNDGDMGDEETNARRDVVQNVIVGTLAGAREGWDAAVEALKA